MIIGNCFGSGCKGPNGQHVVQEFGDGNLWCIICDALLPAQPVEDLWWRYHQNNVDLEKTG